MSTNDTTDIEALLDSPIQTTSKVDREQVILPASELDPRLKSSSYSSSTLLHGCPRKYQLYKLQSQVRPEDSERDTNTTVTFSYGTVVGIGIQELLQGKTQEEAIWQMFINYEAGYLDEHFKAKKSFTSAVYAIMQFSSIYEEHSLSEYEVVMYDGKPAVELGFIITMPDGYKYKGWVDVVLRHKVSGIVTVLELKTTGARWVSPTTYVNSAQAIGYSVVLDMLFPDISSYNVIYLIYSSSTKAYTVLPYNKTLYQRALWLQLLNSDTKLVEMYADGDSLQPFPMHGESCFSYFTDCKYLGLCTLPTEHLVSPLTKGDLKALEMAEAEYHFHVDFFDLVDKQLARGEA